MMTRVFIASEEHRPVPMNRLLCGDVGFGKTEVALRAAFKAIMGGKQVAILVPTTILALQHYQTALSRMNGYPVTVEMLSRFKKPKEQAEILRRVKRGEIDVLIGTHMRESPGLPRKISPPVSWSRISNSRLITPSSRIAPVIYS